MGVCKIELKFLVNILESPTLVWLFTHDWLREHKFKANHTHHE